MHLIISGHGTTGAINLSTDNSHSFSVGIEYKLKQKLKHGKELSPEEKAELLQNEQGLADLRRITAKLCRGGKVTFVQCDAEFTYS